MRVALVALLMLLALVDAAAALDLGGRYRVIGKDFDGSTYTGRAEIIVTSKTTCRINWYIGRSIWRGICMRNGRAFSAGYALGKAIGLAIYEIKDDGTLEGLWTLADKNGVGQERLVPER